ncbi:hypothetical protein JAAARDRAFT_61228 [Jaapia argillacea MUCL 33604]|uniref:Uncharacterized protein n=1 Tax=Jaapia argillacea MUCL 33604 TaxID=933084 RepID=A0A067PI59_9AGAM|nr:hypothetical protein JAAARDRAFT_61228 [Jaapia argillacea MUCL 33604]
MAEWKHISFSDEIDKHPLHSPILEIMRVVYRQHDPDHEPFEIDQWRSCSSLLYNVHCMPYTEPRTDNLELYIREGRPGSRDTKTHFVVDFMARKVHDKYSDDWSDLPADAGELVDKVVAVVKECANKDRAALAKLHLEHDEREKKAQMDHKNEVEAFCGRLADLRLLDIDNIPLDVPDECPLCKRPLTTCAACHRVCCWSDPLAGLDICSGWDADEMERCMEHADHAYCRHCRKGTEDRVDRLVQCEVCDVWHCSEDLSWCIGRPPGTSPTEPEAVVAHSDEPPSGGRRSSVLLKTQHRQHPPKAMVCAKCLEKRQEAGWKTCHSASCWSNASDYKWRARGIQHTRICDECSPDGGQWCENHRNWLCDDCAAKPSHSNVE